MSDELRSSVHGPDQYWSDKLPPSRGQYQTIAVLALQLLEVEAPQSRLDASIAITRLRHALQSPDGPRRPPPVEPF